MPRLPRTAVAVPLLALTLLAHRPVDAAVAVGGTGSIRPPVAADELSPGTRRALRAGLAPAARDANEQAMYPLFRWPLERALGDGTMIVNYTDLDPTPGRLDYSGGAWNYDGHTGTDIGLPDFRAMDRGVRVLAAAAGTVAYVGGPTPDDRHCTFDWPDDGNWIWVAAGDGTYHEYLHLRANSRTVAVGDPVSAGQMLGLVGSSGYSTLPHLHFEAGDDGGPGGAYEFRDPFTGSANPLPSLWQNQAAYAGAQPVRFFDLGVFPESAVRGSIYNTSFCDVMERIPQPTVFGRDELRLCMWFQFQGPAGDSITIRVKKPDGSVYGDFGDRAADAQSYGWFWAWFWFQPYVSAGDDGTWRLQVWRQGALQAERTFTVGATTQWGPRFAPPAGRSFRIDGSVQRDTLRRAATSPPVTYALLGAPPFVSLVQDSIVQVAAASTQPTRSAWFQAVMTDAQARRDTAWFHVVDFSKPLEPSTAGAEAVAPPVALRAAPSPFVDHTTVRWTLSRSGRVHATVLDVGGRRIRDLLDAPLAAGPHEIRWDGRDEAGARAAPGLYFVRVRAADHEAAVRVVLAR